MPTSTDGHGENITDRYVEHPRNARCSQRENREAIGFSGCDPFIGVWAFGHVFEAGPILRDIFDPIQSDRFCVLISHIVTLCAFWLIDQPAEVGVCSVSRQAALTMIDLRFDRCGCYVEDMIEIVPPTPELLDQIELWLQEEEREYNGGDRETRGFLCNWSPARWEDGSVHVLVVDGQPLGFLVGVDILEIHPDHRGRGYGKLLADFMLKRAFDQDYAVVEIQIAPESAEPFWVKGMGFIADYDDRRYRNGLYAAKVLPRLFSLGDGERVPVIIEFFNEKKRYASEAPFLTWVGEGERLPDGSIQLPERVVGYDHTSASNIENHIRIVVGGQEVYFHRSKYGKDHGTKRDPGCEHFIDRITSPV